MRRPLATVPTLGGSRFLSVALLALALMVAACASPSGSAPGSVGGPSPTVAGNGGNGTGPGTTLTACEIVTPADIDAALGLAAGTATAGRLTENPSTDEPYASECSYLAQAWGGMVVQVLPSYGLTYYGTLVPQLAERAEALDIGDGGLWVDDIERGYFLKGTVLVLVNFTRLVPSGPFRDPTIALGEAAIARL